MATYFMSVKKIYSEISKSLTVECFWQNKSTGFHGLLNYVKCF